MRARCRAWLLCALLVLARQAGQSFRTSFALPPQSGLQRRALLLGTAISVPAEVRAESGAGAVAKLKECEAEVSKIMGGLSSSASNVFAMTPAQASEANTRGPPKMGSFASTDGPCSTSALRSAAETLAKSPPSGLNRQQREKLENGPKRIVEAREAIVEANNQKQGARLFGAVKRYIEATSSLLVAAPWVRAVGDIDSTCNNYGKNRLQCLATLQGSKPELIWIIEWQKSADLWYWCIILGI